MRLAPSSKMSQASIVPWWPSSRASERARSSAHLSIPSSAMLRVHLQAEPGVHRIEQGEAEQAPVFVFSHASDALGS